MKKMTVQFLAMIYFILLSPVNLLSQTNPNHDHDHSRCGTMPYLEMLQEKYPEIMENRSKIEAHTQKVIKNKHNQKKIEGVITIPVVVHVLYNTPEENISDAQIFSQIEVLNEDFRRLNADASNTPADFLPVAADSEIEFCLANIAPNGSLTTGITRTYTTHTSWSHGSSMQFSDQGGIDSWNTGDYLNIWVCNIAGGILGFAQLPGGPAATDGVVCSPAYFGNTGYVFYPYDLGRTMTHEVGHWLGLYHIWGDGDCTDDDLISDTPNAGFPNYTDFGCAYPGNNSCNEGEGDLPDMFQNYMDYSTDACFNLFTTGQKDRMRALFEPGGFRESLLSSPACSSFPDHCSNNVKDNDETDVDCGGSCAVCPTCNDGFQNGDEEGVDCGGSCMVCMTCSDGIQNQGETDIDCGGVFCRPCNDICEGALVIEYGANLTGSTNSSSNTDLPALCGDVSNPNQGVWFTFEGTGGEMTISTDNVDTDYDTNLQLYSGNCNDLTCIDGSEDSGGIYVDGFTSEISFNSESNINYYVYLSGFFGFTGNYELSVEASLPLSINHNRICDVPTEGQSQVTVIIAGGIAPYQVSGNFNGEVEENEAFIFIMEDSETSYEIIAIDADGTEISVLEEVLPCTKLPVELLAFEGEVQTEGNLLQWTTASELNNHFFTLAYSTNGQNFDFLQKMAGNGTTSTVNHYDFLHRNAPKGTTYYQLSQTDLDGTTKNLGVISLQRGETTAISTIEVYPTATNRQLNISYGFASKSNTAVLNIYDLTGRIVKSQTLDNRNPNSSLQVDVHNLTTGLYILRIENGLEMLSAKFMKF